MSDVADWIQAIVFFLALVGFGALAVYCIWLIPMDLTLKWIFSFLAIAGVLVILYVAFEQSGWDWWSNF
jgi:hypothetical protein